MTRYLSTFAEHSCGLHPKSRAQAFRAASYADWPFLEVCQNQNHNITSMYLILIFSISLNLADHCRDLSPWERYPLIFEIP